jgi:hypothetical protein
MTSKRDEYKVSMKDARTGHKSFTLVNASSEDEARKVAEKHHGHDNSHGTRPQVIVSIEKRGR